VSVRVSSDDIAGERMAYRSNLLGEFGEPARSRTENLQIKSLLLCQLSYGPTRRRERIVSTRSVLLKPARENWCARQDSNLRPLAPEANALSR
jgi:hypothetical protein